MFSYKFNSCLCVNKALNIEATKIKEFYVTIHNSAQLKVKIATAYTDQNKRCVPLTAALYNTSRESSCVAFVQC